ncbi:hypothetical protein L1049_014053 [Liquidambar formosana]|uniref:ADP-ribosyl cyclase/cyclic ADP-ribose hydrolase n=1 Tax=Liquidambar formosana TaxID=63359 RepID=A0AAP0RLL8_LIQFO
MVHEAFLSFKRLMASAIENTYRLNDLPDVATTPSSSHNQALDERFVVFFMCQCQSKDASCLMGALAIHSGMTMFPWKLNPIHLTCENPSINFNCSSPFVLCHYNGCRKKPLSLPPLALADGAMYDVFLSFRGEDTRKNFIDHLYFALKNAGINAFRDDNELPRGEEIKLIPTAQSNPRFQEFGHLFLKKICSFQLVLEELVELWRQGTVEKLSNSWFCLHFTTPIRWM